MFSSTGAHTGSSKDFLENLFLVLTDDEVSRRCRDLKFVRVVVPTPQLHSQLVDELHQIRAYFNPNTSKLSLIYSFCVRDDIIKMMISSLLSLRG